MDNPTFGIILSLAQATIFIDDSMEAECCKQPFVSRLFTVVTLHCSVCDSGL